MLHKMSLPRTYSGSLSFVETNVDLETFSKCPICGKNISPNFLYAHLSHFGDSLDVEKVSSNSLVNALYECPDCKNGILVSYNVSYDLGTSSYNNHEISKWNTFKIRSIAPTPIAQFPFNEIISSISPRFKDIYMQSLQAKFDGKNELVGIGYRKSIEFLIKDYLIHINHEEKDNIPTMHLGDCIKLIENTKIQHLAKASTWLGNDETHYVRKHTDKDIEDLERFLNTLVGYLSFELTADEAESFINK